MLVQLLDLVHGALDLFILFLLSPLDAASFGGVAQALVLAYTHHFGLGFTILAHELIIVFDKEVYKLLLTLRETVHRHLEILSLNPSAVALAVLNSNFKLEGDRSHFE